jgi:Transposase and inactivated derivatives
MDRGDRSENIFHDNEDRRRFMTALGQTCQRTGWLVHAFVLMGNHYHLLLETPEPNLSRGMHWLQTTYTVRHNKRHNLRGHLFQGRYKAIAVESDSGGYFATVSDYIHLNPLRAGLLRSALKLGAYQWSSFPMLYASPRDRPEWLEPTRVLAAHGEKDTPAGRRRYRLAMEQRASRERQAPKPSATEWQTVREAWAIGSHEFRRRMRGMLLDQQPMAADRIAPAWHDEEEATRLISIGKALLRLGNLATLPKNSSAKIALAAFVKARTTVSNRWLGEQLAMGHASRVSRYCQEAADRPDVAKLQKLLQKAQSKA